MTDPEPTEGSGASSLPPGLFVFAAAGVCLGLNDVWRFPSLLSEHGSFWFPLIYLAGVLLVGMPLMAAELTLARLGHSRPSKNFGFVVERSGIGGLWQYAGIIVLVAVFLILSYTTVIASWMTAYAVRAVAGGLDGISLGAARLMFHSLITDPERMLGWHTLFVLALGWIASREVSDGLGRVSRILVTAIFGIIVLLVFSSLLGLDTENISVLIRALDPARLSPSLVADALTQSFFTLGVCMGAMMILGTYLPPDARVGPLVSSVVLMDILFVVLASVAVLPTLPVGDATGLQGVVYAMETVPMLLSNVPFGRVFLAAFYVLLLLLVVTTAVVLMEFLVAWVGHKTRRPRAIVARIAAVLVWCGGLVSMLSFSILSFDFEFVGEMKNFGMFDVMDILSSQILLPIIGLLMAVFVGWHITRTDFETVMGWRYAASVLHHLKRWWVPLVVTAIFIILVFGRVF